MAPLKTRLLGKIAEHFPELRYERAQLNQQGWDNYVIILDDRLVFRFPRNAYRAERFQVELKLLDHLKDRSPLPVPDYSYLPDDKSFGGYPLINGRPLRRSTVARFNRYQKYALAEVLGDFLSELHALPVELAATWGIQEEPGGYWWSQANAARMFTEMQVLLFPKLNVGERSFLDDHFTGYLGLSFDFDKAVVHSDFLPEHILVDPETKRVAGIIDFADAEVSDPAVDFSFMWAYGQRFVEDMLGHYRFSVDPDFLERSKFPPRVHSAVHMLEILQGVEIPLSYEESRKRFNREMTLFAA